MTIWLAIFMGLLQGATELFPVSSLGHAVVVPALFHLPYRPGDPAFVPFLVLLHLGTAAALLVLYWTDWVQVVRAFLRAAVRGRIADGTERFAMQLVVATVPAGVLGFFLEKPLKSLFAAPRLAAGFLVLNGFLLIGAEWLRRRREREAGHTGRSRAEQERSFAEVSDLGMRAAAIVGLCQALALLPGISRAGATMAGGLVAGLRHQEAARLSFMLATPIIGVAGLLEVPQLGGSGASLPAYVAGALVAGLAAYLSARFLLRYFRVGRLEPYGIYCLLLGAVALALLR
ncbi:MAG: undecaprenyl-diphosphate phosphatase [Candidatus Dormibacteria bacterium]